MDEARGFCRRFFDWYNEEHRHSGLRYLTPNQVHSGDSTRVVSARQRVLDEAHARHPERFVRRPPQALGPPAAVYINPPPDVAHDGGAPSATEVAEADPQPTLQMPIADVPELQVSLQVQLNRPIGRNAEVAH